jgi:hypothetical protein
VSVEGSATPPTQGNRRIDRVLAEDYLDGLRELPLVEVRRLRADAEQEEVDLSYLRRMIQGRLDILRAELNRRDSASTDTLVQGLAAILADEPRAPARGSGRHTTVEPSRADSHRRYVEALVPTSTCPTPGPAPPTSSRTRCAPCRRRSRGCPPSAVRCRP